MRTTIARVRPPVRALLVAGVAIPVLFVVGIAVGQDRFERALSHKALVAIWASQRANNGERLVYVGQPPPSADFYSRGKSDPRAGYRDARPAARRSGGGLHRASRRRSRAASGSRRARGSSRSANSATTVCCTKRRAEQPRHAGHSVRGFHRLCYAGPRSERRAPAREVRQVARRARAAACAPRPPGRARSRRSTVRRRAIPGLRAARPPARKNLNMRSPSHSRLAGDFSGASTPSRNTFADDASEIGHR